VDVPDAATMLGEVGGGGRGGGQWIPEWNHLTVCCSRFFLSPACSVVTEVGDGVLRSPDGRR